MSNQLVPSSRSQVSVGVDNFTTALNGYLTELGLPTDRILVPVTERQRVINNIPEIITTIQPQKLRGSLYLSKFIAACGAGLFDAALNFIWDETVVNLRSKVASFDLDYFYDSIVTDPAKRQKLRDESDLVKIEEWELIRGCHLTGILSDIGYKHLDYIRDMRNWASAAHPNQNELTGFQLVSWLETCIREVIAKEPETSAIEVKRFLSSIRNNALNPTDATYINSGIEYLPTDINKSLLRTLFGMFTAVNTSVQTKNNIRLVVSTCWNLAPDESKHECGLRYASFAANGETDRRTLAHEFLQTVNGLSFLPTDTLIVEMSEKINNLYTAHIGFNNFYNEPSHAKALLAYIPENGVIPALARLKYVKTIVMAKIGNGYGISVMAEQFYNTMIQRFRDDEIREVAKLLFDREFSSRVALSSCLQNYKALVQYFVPLTSNQVTQQAFARIISSTNAQIPHLGNESAYKRIFGLA